MQMRQLEALVGLPLIERVGKVLTLTAAGREVLEYSRRMLAGAARRGESHGRHARRRSRGTGDRRGEHRQVLRAAGTDGILARLSGLQLKLSIQNRDLTLRAMSNNEVDLAIMGRPPEKMAVVAEKFAPHPHVIIAPADHHLAARGRSARRRRQEPFLVRELGIGTRLFTDSYSLDR